MLLRSLLLELLHINTVQILLQSKGFITGSRFEPETKRMEVKKHGTVTDADGSAGRQTETEKPTLKSNTLFPAEGTSEHFVGLVIFS